MVNYMCIVIHIREEAVPLQIPIYYNTISLVQTNTWGTNGTDGKCEHNQDSALYGLMRFDHERTPYIDLKGLISDIPDLACYVQV